MKIKPGGIRAGLEVYKEYLDDSLIKGFATDNAFYSPVATIGTTAVEVWSGLIDPGVTMALKQFKATFVSKFTGLNGSVAGSIAFYWQARSEANVIGSGGTPVGLTGPYVPITSTYAQLIGTLVAVDATLSGNASLGGSIPYAPVRISLMARGLAAANIEAKVKNLTSVLLVGNVIPGT